MRFYLGFFFNFSLYPSIALCRSISIHLSDLPSFPILSRTDLILPDNGCYVIDLLRPNRFRLDVRGLHIDVLWVHLFSLCLVTSPTQLHLSSTPPRRWNVATPPPSYLKLQRATPPAEVKELVLAGLKGGGIAKFGQCSGRR